jgi:hypothetical protein
MLADMVKHTPGAKAWIQLPWIQVYEPFQSLVPWWQMLFARYDIDSRVEAYYYADEPEIWGSEWGPDMAGVRPQDVKATLPHAQRQTSKPLVAVHCDIPLFDAAFGNSFTPVIQGFDLYPLTQAGDLPVSTFRARFKHWDARLVSPTKLFVMQGCGSESPSGESNWGQRNFTFDQAKPYLDVIMEQERDIVFFWAADRADPEMSLVVKDMANYLKSIKKSNSLLYWVKRTIRGLLSILRGA